jgi:NAD(P)-dependent dehydrogenase (short-subunit alcohol dehydrogenase family)
MSGHPAVYNFSGQVALVTGATGGLGPAVIQGFLDAGAVVVGVGRQVDEQRERDMRAQIIGNTDARFSLVAADAQDEASVARVVSDVVTQHGRIDILVNGIGGYYAGDPVAETSQENWQQMLDLNLRPTFLFSKYAARPMAAQHGGRIINVSSRAAYSGRKNAAAYATAKHGVITLTEAQAEELRGEGVTVNAIVPSIIDTPANRAAMPNADKSRWPTAEQVARVVLFLASEDAGLISGAAIPVYGRA